MGFDFVTLPEVPRSEAARFEGLGFTHYFVVSEVSVSIGSTVKFGDTMLKFRVHLNNEEQTLVWQAPVICKRFGTVKKISVQAGDQVTQGMWLVCIEYCLHDMIVGVMCGVCGANVDSEVQYKRKVESSIAARTHSVDLNKSHNCDSDISLAIPSTMVVNAMSEHRNRLSQQRVSQAACPSPSSIVGRSKVKRKTQVRSLVSPAKRARHSHRQSILLSSKRRKKNPNGIRDGAGAKSGVKKPLLSAAAAEMVAERGMAPLIMSSSLSSSKQMIHLTNRALQKAKVDNTKHLIEQRKLALVLDIDHTFLHASREPQGYLVGQCPEFKSTLFTFNLSSDEGQTGVVNPYLIGHRNQPNPTAIPYYIKLRPGFADFINAVKDYFDIHLYTMSVRRYAQEIVKHIEENIYVEGASNEAGNSGDSSSLSSSVGPKAKKPRKTALIKNLVTRDDVPDSNFKSLDRLFPCDQRAVIIVDDRVDVWPGVMDSVIQIQKYLFWPSTDEQTVQRPDPTQSSQKGSHFSDVYNARKCLGATYIWYDQPRSKLGSLKECDDSEQSSQSTSSSKSSTTEPVSTECDSPLKSNDPLNEDQNGDPKPSEIEQESSEIGVASKDQSSVEISEEKESKEEERYVMDALDHKVKKMLSKEFERFGVQRISVKRDHITVATFKSPPSEFLSFLGRSWIPHHAKKLTHLTNARVKFQLNAPELRRRDNDRILGCLKHVLINVAQSFDFDGFDCEAGLTGGLPSSMSKEEVMDSDTDSSESKSESIGEPSPLQSSPSSVSDAQNDADKKATIKKRKRKDRTDECDCRSLLSRERRKVFEGCRFVFSGLWPRETEIRRRDLWVLAATYGGDCVETLSEDNREGVTHCVSARMGSEKTRCALKNKVELVHPNWIKNSVVHFRQSDIEVYRPVNFIEDRERFAREQQLSHAGSDSSSSSSTSSLKWAGSAKQQSEGVEIENASISRSDSDNRKRTLAKSQSSDFKFSSLISDWSPSNTSEIPSGSAFESAGVTPDAGISSGNLTVADKDDDVSDDWMDSLDAELDELAG